MLSAFYTLYITFLHMHTQQFPLHGSSYMSWRWWHSQEHFLYLKAALSVFYTCYSNCWLMLYLLVKGKQQLPGYSLLSYSNHNNIFLRSQTVTIAVFFLSEGKRSQHGFHPVNTFVKEPKFKAEVQLCQSLKRIFLTASVCLTVFFHMLFGGVKWSENMPHPAEINERVWHFHLWATRSRAW